MREPHRQSLVSARVGVARGGRDLGVLSPRMNQYESQREPIGTPAVRTLAVRGPLPLGDEHRPRERDAGAARAWSTRWWAGSGAATALMALGGLVALVPAAPRAREATAPAAAAAPRSRPRAAEPRGEPPRPARRASRWWCRSSACCSLNLGRDPHAIGSPLVGRPAPAFALRAGGRRRAGDARVAARPAGGPQLLGHLVRALLRGAPGCWCARPAALGDRVQFLGVVYEDEEEQVRGFLARQGERLPVAPRSRQPRPRSPTASSACPRRTSSTPRAGSPRSTSGRSTRRRSPRSSRRRGARAVTRPLGSLRRAAGLALAAVGLVAAHAPAQEPAAPPIPRASSGRRAAARSHGAALDARTDEVAGAAALPGVPGPLRGRLARDHGRRT